MDINRIREFIIRKKISIASNTVNSNHHHATNKTNSTQNPYVKSAAGKAMWNDRYMNMSKAMRNWQIACATIAILMLGQIILIGKLATESKIKPYVVETNQGIPYTIKEVTEISAKDQLLINYAINQFVINAKTIIADTVAEKTLLDKLYAYSSGNAVNFLQDFYAKNNPFELASNYTISIHIINSLPISQNTWQIIWEETKHQSSNGNAIGTSRWIGQFTYEFRAINPKHISDNPFGIYITNIVWSQNQITPKT